MKLSKHEQKSISRIVERKKRREKEKAGYAKGGSAQREIDRERQKALREMVNEFLATFDGNKSRASMSLGADRAAFSRWCSGKTRVPEWVEDAIAKRMENENDNNSM